MTVTDSSTIWVAGKLSHEHVSGVRAVENNLIELEIEEMGPVLVAVMSLRVAGLANIPATARRPDVDFILNIPKDALFDGDLINFAYNLPVGLGGMGDLLRAVNHKNLRGYICPERKFIFRALSQHDAVSRIEMLNNNTLLIHRHKMAAYQILAINEYEITADVIRDNIQRFGKSRTILVNNPNGRITPEAVDAAKTAGVRIVDIRQLLGALNS